MYFYKYNNKIKKKLIKKIYKKLLEVFEFKIKY